MLEIKDLHVHYGAIHALKGISLTVGDGELVSLIGANGAGKTTALHTISGLLAASSGSVTLDGQDLQKVPPTPSSAWALPMCRRAGTYSPA